MGVAVLYGLRSLRNLLAHFKYVECCFDMA